MLLLDGGFVRKRLRAILGSEVRAGDVVEYCDDVGRSPALCGLRLHRIYFYDAPPAEQELIHPVDGARVKLKVDPVWEHSTELHEELARSDDFALRLGEIQAARGGWRLGSRAMREIRRQSRQVAADDYVPDLVQKGVDLRVGLDIARIALRRQADVIVLVTGDSDFIPAMKFARREGVRVYLDTMGQAPRQMLREHVDRFLPPVAHG